MVRPRTATGKFEKAVAKRARTRVSLRLYIAGSSPRSSRALSSVKALCDQYLAGRYDLEVVDVYQQPRRAREEQILATPTLVRERPGPVRRFVGDMSDAGRLLAGLDLKKGGHKADASSTKATKRTPRR